MFSSILYVSLLVRTKAFQYALIALIALSCILHLGQKTLAYKQLSLHFSPFSNEIKGRLPAQTSPEEVHRLVMGKKDLEHQAELTKCGGGLRAHKEMFGSLILTVTDAEHCTAITIIGLNNKEFRIEDRPTASVEGGKGELLVPAELGDLMQAGTNEVQLRVHTANFETSDYIVLVVR